MRPRHAPILFLLVAAMTAVNARTAAAQISALVSPGRLAKAHASLEGIGSCLSCHAAGQQVAAGRCLTCHQPVARRIAQKKGVHRNVTTDCTSCHVEHAGVDAELRPFDQRKFNHATDAAFPLDGQHAAVATNCTACHKTRSFLTVSASCASCHRDVHKGSLGAKCETCHSTAIRFSETRVKFDHARTTFPLTGGHTRATCESCHRNSMFKGIASTCAGCHTDPHRGQFKGACSSCHVTDNWRTAKIDHSRTAFPLRGAHARVACAQCHTKPALQVKAASSTCATCHADPHKGNFQQDCRACHNESNFRKGTFDHATTSFALVDGHAGLTCAACHDPRARLKPGTTDTARLKPGTTNITARSQPSAATAVDFRGLKTDCASCHADVHQGELPGRCETCHSPKTFHVTSFTHAKQRAFFAGQHGPLTCVACHPPAGTRPQQRAATTAVMARVGLSRTSDTCTSCHRDVHDGQLGTACDTCHTVDTPHFAVPSFRHELTKFPLTGKHAAAQCQDCHKAPAIGGSGTKTVRQFRGVSTTCATCHPDPHRGELPAACETCHNTDTFTIRNYQHRNARALRAFFTGRHLVGCEACHPATRNVTALVTRAGSSPRPLQSFKARTECVSCHTDIHRGALGPRCETCHRP